MNFDFSKQRNKIIFTTGRKKEWISVSNILFITVDLTLCSVFVQHKKDPYYFVKQLKEFEIELSEYGFFKANGNTIVNGYFVECLEKVNKKYILKLKDEKRITLSRRQYSKIRKIMSK